MNFSRLRIALPGSAAPALPESANGHAAASTIRSSSVRFASRWSQFGPYLIASLLLAFGYLHYAPGTDYSLSAEHYRAWSFPAFRYSDLIWLYLRDELDRRPLPYIDYPLEYPALTGLLSWLFSWSSDLPTYFALAYVLLAATALLTIWSLQRLSGANVWLFAVSPALFFYSGHQWDMAAIGVATASLLALQRGREGWGTAGLVAATSLKLFPVVFIAAAVVERVRDRRYRSAASIAIGFTIGTIAFNLPVAIASFDGWSFFFRWNRDRLADSGIWVLWRGVSTEDLTRWSLVAAIAGGVALTLFAFRTRGPIFIPLGAAYLLWWLLVNKTFTTHLMLWVFLALALLSAPWPLWGLAVAIDVAGFQLGNYLNLYNVAEFRHSPLIRKAVENIYDPMQIARSITLLLCSLWSIHVLRGERSRARYVNFIPPPRAIWRPFLAAERPAFIAVNWQSVVIKAARPVVLTGALTATAVLMTWPYALHLGSATLVGFDPFLQIWLSEWIQHILVTGPLRLYDANIFYPFAQTLAYTDANMPGALLAAPLRILTGDPILTNSLLTLATFVLAAGGVYTLIVYLTGNRGAAFVAGLAYAFLPYRMIHLWHLNWLEGAWLPWVLLALLRLFDRPTLLRGATLGIMAALLVLTSFYFSVQIVIVCAVVIVARSIAERRLPSREIGRALLTAVFVAALVAAPLYVPYLQVRDQQLLERSIVDAEQYKALPQSYLQLAPWHAPNGLQRLVAVRSGPNESLTEVGQAQHADGHQHAEMVIEDALYPGAIAAIFAVVGLALWRVRRWLAFSLAAIGLLAFVLSLGPTLGPRHGAGPSLPYSWLFDHLPFFRAMRVPARLGGLADLMVVLLAGLGLAAAWQTFSSSRHRAWRQGWIGPALTFILAAAVLADLWTGTIPLESIDLSPDASAAGRWLATQPEGAVMEFPAESVFADPAAASVRRHYGESMFRSTTHWKPLVNGNSGFIPRAYSDFIERFVGDLERPDGSHTPRLSHLDSDTVHLLQQLDVRYLVFHRSQYPVEDWPAVASQLTDLVASGALVHSGDYGEASIYVVSPVRPAVATPRVSLFAPTLMAPKAAWSPWVGVENSAGMPSVLALTRPSLLETTWYDQDGRLLWTWTERLPLPVVVDDPYLLCGATECLTSRPFADLAHLPPPIGDDSWRPEEPGHYVVRLQLTGDHPLDCQVDLDVVSDADEIRQRPEEQSFRWAECVAGHRYPINDPGALPFALSPPSVTLIAGTATVDVAVTPRRDEEVRGWFILAPPGAPEPWRDAVYQSPVQQKVLLAREPAAFEWQSTIGPEVESGVYGLTVWFHRRGPSDWEHAAGGDIKLAPIVVDEDGTLRWAGPVRIHFAGTPPPLMPGKSTRVALAVDGVSNRIHCTSTWRLVAGSETIAAGNAGPCARAEIAVPASVTPGPYRLEIDALADQGEGLELNDGVSVQVVVGNPLSVDDPS